jgi:putrescine aminotransferase
MSTEVQLLELYHKHVGSGSARMARLMSSPIIQRAEGNYMYSAAGERFLSCGGFSVFLFGHQHPEIVEAVAEQLRTMALCGPVILHEGQAHAAQALADVCEEGIDCVFFLNSGAEATELGIKLARLNGKRRLIATEGGYHGKTIGALSVTGRDVFRAPFEPLLGGVTFVPFGDAEAIEAELTQDSCVVIEPIQGEGGVRVPQAGYLSAVARACRSHGALLMLDEIQTGLGRTGYMWGSQADEVCPDIRLTGKALGGGVVPVSAVVASEQIFRPLGRDPMLHTSTNSGNPIAAAAVIASIELIRRHDVPRLAAALGDRLQAMLREIVGAQCPHLVSEVRGRGLLLGIDMREPMYAAELILELQDRGVFVSSTLNSHTTVRLTPSVFFGEEEIAWLRDAVEGAMQALAARHPDADC